ncbi:MAG: hypothetical protein JWP89_4284 [Schlesneria sp.]|nr:hypothetical protein [Schlesneria sp.]
MAVVRIRLAIAAILVIPFASLATADEPKAAIAVAVDVIVAQPAQVAVEKAADEPEVVVKKKKVRAAIAFEDLVAPLVQALDGNIDLKAADAQVQQWIPQFTEQFKPMLWTELNFIRQTCDLTPEQRPKVKAAGDAALAEAVRKMAELQGGRNAGRAGQQPEPRKMIRAALKQALQETLSPEAMEKFADELNLRAERRKQAAILSALSRLDSAMCLTAEQREVIEASITGGWKEQWEQWLVLAIYGDQYFPIIPDALVVAHLNADQKAVWDGLQKVDFGYWGGGAQVEEDGWWGGKPDVRAAKPAKLLREVRAE